MTGRVWLALVCGLLLGGDDEYAKFEGVWRFALVEVEGVQQPEAPFETNKLILSKDGRFIVVQGPRITRGALKLDPAQTPKHYDVTITEGSAKGQTFLGIYEMEGDTYRMARIEVGRRELAGVWQAVSYWLDGEKASDEDMKKIQLTIDAGGKAHARREGTVFIAAATEIDPDKNPMTIDMAYTEGDPKGRTALGIYKIEDDVLTICRAAPGKARPSEFSSQPGSGHTLMTYRREKSR